MTDETHRGGCLCGAVRYETPGPMRPVVACHCKQCQRTSGNHVAATAAPRETVAIHGEVTWFRSSPEARRGFCGICGANLFWDGPGTHLSIMAGTLDAPTGLRLAGHIFCADRGDWFELTDGLPQFPADDASMTTQVP